MSGTTIAFNEIPYTWLVPGEYVEVRANYTKNGALDWPANALIISQMLATGTATANTPYPIITNTQAHVLFGRGSIAAQQADAFIAANPYTPLTMIGVADNGSGVAATSTLTFTSTATGAGTTSIAVGNDVVTFGAASTDTATMQATAAAAAINANADLPVTATAALAVVTTTFRHKGECGSALTIRVTSTAAGTGCTVAAGVAGSGNPTITSAIAAIAGTWFTDIVVPWTDATTLGALETELATRYGAMGQLDAQAYVALNATYGAASTYASTRESRYVCTIPANGSQTPPWVWAASLGGVAAFQSANDPARQLRGLALPGVQAPPAANLFTETSRNLLLGMGLSTFTTEQDGTVVLERVVTNNTLTPDNVPDTAWRDLRVLKVNSRVRYDWRTFVALNWPNNKLADDGSLAAEYDPTVATPARLKASWVGRSRLYEQAGWIENSAANGKLAVFVRDGTDVNRVNARQPITVIGALMVLAGALEFDA